jgi:hypothetical protein
MSKILQTAPRPAGIVLPAAPVAKTDLIVLTQHSKAIFIPVQWPTDSELYRSGLHMDGLRKAAFDTREMREFNAYGEMHLAWAHASMLLNDELNMEVAKYANAMTGAIRKRSTDMFKIGYKPKSRSNKGLLLTNMADQPDEE